MNRNQDLFSTNDLSLAAAIIATRTSSVSQIDWKGREAFFQFHNSPTLERVVSKFWNKDLSSDCLTYFEAMRYLKKRLFGGRDAQ